MDKNTDKDLKGLDEKNIVSKKRKNIFVFILITQIVICFIIVFGLFLTKMFFKTKYDYITKKISFALKDNSLKIFIENFMNKLKEKNENAKKEQNNNQEEKDKKQINSSQEKENVNSKETEQTFNSLCSVNNDDDDVIFFTFIYPLNGKITSKYGKRENPILKGMQDFHYGVDISAKDNTPIVSIADGVVELKSFSKKSGNFVSIKHGEFYESLYAHCNKIFVDKGKFVKKGEKIALSGHTGNTTGAHLHLGIKKNGKWIDPKTIFPNLI